MFYGVPDNIYRDGVNALLNNGRKNNAQFVMFTEKKGKYNYHDMGTDVCHRPLVNFKGSYPSETPLFIVTKGCGDKWENFQKKISKRYGPWLVNESPWADPHLVKDMDIIKKSGFHISCDFPSNYFMSTCIVTRHSWEFSDGGIRDWTLYVEEFGIHPTTALIMRYHSFVTVTGDISNNRWGMHNAFSENEPREYYQNLFNKNLVNPSPNYRITKSYAHVDHLWTKAEIRCRAWDTNSIFDLMWKIYKDLSKGEDTSKIDTSEFEKVNPFYDIIREIEAKERRAANSKIIPKKYMPEIGRRITEILSRG